MAWAKTTGLEIAGLFYEAERREEREVLGWEHWRRYCAEAHRAAARRYAAKQRALLPPGRRAGRPPKAKFCRLEFRRLRAEGLSLRLCALRFGVSPTAAYEAERRGGRCACATCRPGEVRRRRPRPAPSAPTPHPFDAAREILARLSSRRRP